MSIKINDATHNRPEGHRVVDAPAVQVDFNKYVRQLKNEKAWATGDRNAITVFKTPGVTVVISALHKGASITDLQVDGLLILQVMEGAISITNDSNNAMLADKQMLVLHTTPSSNSNIAAIEDSIIQLSYIKTILSSEDNII